MAFGAKVLLLEGESANGIQEGALSGLSQIAGGAVFRGLPRLCASFINRQVRAHKVRGDIEVAHMGLIYIYIYRGTELYKIRMIYMSTN